MCMNELKELKYAIEEVEDELKHSHAVELKTADKRYNRKAALRAIHTLHTMLIEVEFLVRQVPGPGTIVYNKVEVQKSPVKEVKPIKEVKPVEDKIENKE